MDFYKQFLQVFQQPYEMKEPQLIDLTYLWKVDNYNTIPLNEPRLSMAFMIAKDSYSLELSKDDYLNVKLRQDKPCEPASKFLCSVGLVDRHGKLRHFVRKEAKMGKGSQTKDLLKIPSSVLAREWSDVIPMDIISICLTINLQTENCLLSAHDSDRSLETLSCDLKKLHEDKTDSDVVLKVGDTEFKAHRLVLSARSAVFAQMFRQNAKESSKGSIDTKDVEVSIFGNILYYIYTGKVQGLTSDTASKMIEAADKYKLYELKSMSISFLVANLTMDNICDAVLLAKKFCDEQLEKAALEFIRKNTTTVINSIQWKDFKSKHTEIANSVLSSILLSVQMT